MKIITKLNLSLLIFVNILTATVTAYGAASDAGSSASVAVQTRDLSAEAHDLQREMIELRKKMDVLAERQGELLGSQAALEQEIKPQESAVPKPFDHDDPTVAVEAVDDATIQTTEQEVISAREFEENQNIEDFQALPYGHTLLANLGGTAVITSPFIHSRYDFRGSELITNYSSVNKDVAALRQRRDFIYQMESAGLRMPNFPIVALSGQVEAVAFNRRQFSGRNVNDINLTTAEFDIQAMANPDFTAFMSFAYDNSPPGRGPRVANSNISLDNGFITWGNLTKRPIYATVGQIFVPFGQFSTYLISDPFNKIMFRTKARPLVLGYQSMDDLGFYGSIYAFEGDARTGTFKSGSPTRSSNGHIHSFGGNAGYIFEKNGVTGGAGISYINNVADAGGMQSTINGVPFGGFGTSSVTEVLDHRVPGFDVRGFLSWHSYTLLGEYTTTTRSFNVMDLSFNGEGAQPDAYHVELAKTFNLFKRPSTASIGYDHSDEALALGIPKRRYEIGMSTAIWRNTLLSFEYNYAVNYKKKDRASGLGSPIFTRPGKISNAVIAQIDVYF